MKRREIRKKLKNFNRLMAEVEQKKDEINRKNDIIDQLRMEYFDLKNAYKTKDEMDSDEKTREALKILHEEYIELQESFEKEQADNIDLKFELKQKEKLLNGLLEDARKTSILGYNAAGITYLLEHIRTLEDELAKEEHRAVSTLRQNVWADLRGNRYGTLTRMQRDQIHFPNLDPDCVYYLPSHNTFHAAKWCYSLDFSPPSKEITLDQAIQMKLKPCSKCVEPEYYDQFFDDDYERMIT